MFNHFAAAPFSLLYSLGGIIQHIYLSVLSENLKRCFAFLETAPFENHTTSLWLSEINPILLLITVPLSAHARHFPRRWQLREE